MGHLTGLSGKNSALSCKLVSQRMVASEMKDLVIATDESISAKHYESYKKSQQTLMGLIDNYSEIGSPVEKKLAAINSKSSWN